MIGCYKIIDAVHHNKYRRVKLKGNAGLEALAGEGWHMINEWGVPGTG
jgi:hypothetical protein